MDDFNPFRSDLSKTFTMPECLKDRYYISGENGEESWNTDTVTQDGTITLVTVALLVFGYLANSWCRHKTSQQRSEPQLYPDVYETPYLYEAATVMPFLNLDLNPNQKMVIGVALSLRTRIQVTSSTFKGLWINEEGYSKEKTDQAITNLIRQRSIPGSQERENLLKLLPTVHHFDDVSDLGGLPDLIERHFPRTISNAAFYPQAAAAGQLVDDEPTSSSSSSQTAGNILPAASLVLDSSQLPPEETVAGLPPPSSSPTDGPLLLQAWC